MNNFIYENKTKVFFGKGGVKEYLRSLLDKYSGTVMLAYGGGSIKKNGIYDEITSILSASGKEFVEFSGIMPNPTYAKVQEGAALACEFIFVTRLLKNASASSKKITAFFSAAVLKRRVRFLLVSPTYFDSISA